MNAMATDYFFLIVVLLGAVPVHALVSPPVKPPAVGVSNAHDLAPAASSQAAAALPVASAAVARTPQEHKHGHHSSLDADDPQAANTLASTVMSGTASPIISSGTAPISSGTAPIMDLFHGHASDSSTYTGTARYRSASSTGTAPIIGLLLIVGIVLLLLGLVVMAEGDSLFEFSGIQRSISRAEKIPPRGSALAAAGYPPGSSARATLVGGSRTPFMGASPPASLMGKQIFGQSPPTSMAPRFRAEAPSGGGCGGFTSVGSESTLPQQASASIGGSPGTSLPPTRSTTPALGLAPVQQPPSQQQLQPANRPPPLAPQMILPNTETSLAIPFSDLVLKGPRSFEVFGLSGRALLKAAIDINAAGGSVTISMASARAPMMGAIVHAADSTGTGRKPLLIKSKENSHYGELRQTGQTDFSCVCNNMEVLRIVMQHGELILHSPDAQAQELSKALRCTDADYGQGVEHLEVRVNPGVDAVLVLLCVIGVLLFELPQGAQDMPVSAAPQRA